MEDIIKCSKCINSYAGYNRLNQHFKCCIRCRGYGKKRTEQEKNKANEINGELKYRTQCETSKPVNICFMSNCKSYNTCRICLRDEIYDSDDDDSNSSYSDQCVYDAGDYEVGFSNM